MRLATMKIAFNQYYEATDATPSQTIEQIISGMHRVTVTITIAVLGNWRFGNGTQYFEHAGPGV